MQVDWSNEALDDLAEIRAYFFEDIKNPYAAANVALAIVKAGDALEILPRRGEELPDGTYEIPVLKYPQYRLVYEVGEIVNILHVQTQRTKRPRRPTRR